MTQDDKIRTEAERALHLLPWGVDGRVRDSLEAILAAVTPDEAPPTAPSDTYLVAECRGFDDCGNLIHLSLHPLDEPRRNPVVPGLVEVEWRELRVTDGAVQMRRTRRIHSRESNRRGEA